MKKFKTIIMTVVALFVVAAGFFVYRWSTAKPTCNCMFPNSKRYGVIGSGGSCRVVECVPPAEAPKNNP